MAQWIMKLAPKPDDPRLIPETHVLEGKNWFLQAVHGTHVHAHTKIIKKCNGIFKVCGAILPDKLSVAPIWPAAA